MNAATFAVILAGVTLNAIAQLLLKAGANAVGVIALHPANLLSTGWRLAGEPPILAGLACYVVSVGLWIVALSRVDVSVAYPMLSLGYIVNALGAWYFLGEAFSPQRLLAIALILLGVALIARA
jgi:drug/metabolite transporter (DMT)-like permease